MGRTSSAPPIEVGALRGALASLVRAAWVLERFEEADARRRAGETVLTSRVCSVEQATALRRAFAQVIRLGEQISDGTLPLVREGPKKKNVLKRGDVAVANLVPALRAALDEVDSARSMKDAARSITPILRRVDATLSEPRVARALASVTSDSNRARATGRARTRTSRATVIKLLDALGLRGNYADRVERKLRAAERADRAVGPLIAADLEVLAAGVLASPRAITEYVDALFGANRQRSAKRSRQRG